MKQQKILLGVTGLARSGKDSLGMCCVRRGYKRIAFADALKVATAHIANEDSHLYFDDFAKEQLSHALQMTRRQALQAVGKAVRDSVGPDTWVRRALNDWKSKGCPPTVITDVRYPNEAQAIRAEGGVIVRLVRKGSGLEGDAGKHESEQQLDDELVDIELDNNGSMGDLAAEAFKVMQYLESRQ